MNCSKNLFEYETSMRRLLQNVIGGDKLLNMDKWETEIAVECSHKGFLSEPKFREQTEDGIMHTEYKFPHVTHSGYNFLHQKSVDLLSLHLEEKDYKILSFVGRNEFVSEKELVAKFDTTLERIERIKGLLPEMKHPRNPDHNVLHLSSEGKILLENYNVAKSRKLKNKLIDIAIGIVIGAGGTLAGFVIGLS